jgi:hypothetical protein
VATPTKAIITIATSIYGYGNGDDAEDGGSEGCAWAGACVFSYILKAEPDGYSDELCRPCTLYAPATSSCSVSLTTRTGSSSSLCRSVSSRRSLDDERGQGLCHVSTLYTTLVKKPQQANRASELWRTPLPRTRVNRGAERIGAAHPICGFGLNEAFRCALR